MPGEMLKVVAGNAAGTDIALDNELVIGRSTPGLGSLGGDTEISRVHARLYRDPSGQLVVEDLGSTNGTYVNGARIAGAQALRPGDQVRVGQTTMSVEGPGATRIGAIVPPPATAQPPPPAAVAAQPPTEQLPPAQPPGWGQQPPPGQQPPYGGGPVGGPPGPAGGGTNRNLIIAIAAVAVIALIVAGLAIGGVFKGSSKSKTTAQTTPAATTPAQTTPQITVPTMTDTTPSSNPDSYPPSIQRAFVDACVRGGAPRGICQCTFDKLKARFTFTEFISQARDKIANEARNAARQCVNGQQ